MIYSAAILEGFQVLLKKPRSVLVWTVLGLLFFTIFAYLINIKPSETLIYANGSGVSYEKRFDFSFISSELPYKFWQIGLFFGNGIHTIISHIKRDHQTNHQ